MLRCKGDARSVDKTCLSFGTAVSVQVMCSDRYVIVHICFSKLLYMLPHRYQVLDHIHIGKHLNLFISLGTDETSRRPGA